MPLFYATKTELDLFAIKLTSKLTKYMSWKPDPGSISTDAFYIS